MVKNFTSQHESIATLAEFKDALTEHAALGHCLLKGRLNNDLNGESRAGSTVPADETRWVCLDIDGLPSSTKVDELLKDLGLGSVDYVLQYSCSSGAGSKPTELRCHIFMLLDRPVPAPRLKDWLTNLNLSVNRLRSEVKLSPSKLALKWPLDITVCQNDKLIYIAPPILKGGLDDYHDERIVLVKGSKRKVNAKSIVDLPLDAEALRTRKQDLVNEMREAEGLKAHKGATKLTYGQVEVLTAPGKMDITGIRRDRGFVYLNLNGGDSWGYYHPVLNPSVIFNFKGEPNLATRDINPEYYQQAKEYAATVKEKNTEEVSKKYEHQDDRTTGVRYFVFTDTISDSYYRGSYNHDTSELDIRRATNKEKLADFLKQHGQPVPDFIPEWTYGFDFKNSEIFDPKKRWINRFAPSTYLRNAKSTRRNAKVPPIISKVLMHAVGDDEISYNLFLNWLAFILQKREKAGTAWVLFGVEGTGKGTLFSRILTPIFGDRYCTTKKLHDLEEQYNAFMQETLMVLVDESQVSNSLKVEKLMANLRNYITEPTVSVRAMRTDFFDVINWTNWIFASNKPDPIQIPIHDRRFHVASYQPKKLKITTRELDAIADELQDFAHFLMSFDVDEEKVRTPQYSISRAKIQYLTRSSIDETTEALQHGNINYFLDQLSDGTAAMGSVEQSLAGDEYVKFLGEAYKAIVGQQEHRIPRDQLQRVMQYLIGKVPNTPAKFSKYLRHHGVELDKFRIPSSPHPVSGVRVMWKCDIRTLKDWEEFFREKISPKDLLKRIK